MPPRSAGYASQALVEARDSCMHRPKIMVRYDARTMLLDRSFHSNGSRDV
jgi:hypothetical protein